VKSSGYSNLLSPHLCHCEHHYIVLIVAHFPTARSTFTPESGYRKFRWSNFHEIEHLSLFEVVLFEHNEFSIIFK